MRIFVNALECRRTWVINEDERVRNTNFALAKSVRIVLNEGLRLLGIHYLEEM